MKAGALVFLVFVAGSALVLLTDIFDASGTSLLESFGERPKTADEDPKEELTLEQRVTALEESAAGLRRRIRAAADAPAALAGTDSALKALIARLDELAANAGMLPRDDVAAQLDAIERDFEMRELMVLGTKEVVETGPDEITRERDALREQARKLRETAKDESTLVARLDRVDAALAALEPAGAGGEIKEADAVRQARARFDKAVTALRTKLG